MPDKRWKAVERGAAEGTKRCRKCRIVKNLEDFHIDKSRKDGRRLYCKTCAIEIKANWYVPHPRQRTRKVCKRCKQSKPLSEFGTSGKGKLSSHCKACTRPYQPSGLTNPSDRRRNEQYKHKHSITLAQYNQMLEEQAHRCAICGKHESNLKSRLVIDHDHTTGKKRGLLCNNCNRGIGYLQDSASVVERAFIYLKERS